MGLIISVLVVCVGVYKFIQIYGGSLKKVGYGTVDTCNTDRSSKNSAASCNVPRVKLQRDFLSHEDVEIECTSKVLDRSSKLESSRRFLVTEKEDDCSRSPSPRRFVITEDDAGRSDLREFMVAKGTPKDRPDTKRFVLIDTKEDFREISPLPLPKQFVITQSSSSISGNTTKGIGIDLNYLSFNGREIENLKNVDENILLQNTHDISRSSRNLPSFSIKESPINNVESSLTSYNSYENNEGDRLATSIYQKYSQEPEEFHRDPSPYPNLDVSIRRGSISSELLDTAKVSVAEVDEESYNTPNKIDVILKTSNFNTTEYWSNKVLVEPSKNYRPKHESKSKRDFNEKDERKRSKSASRSKEREADRNMRKVNSSSKMFDEDFEEPSSLFISILNKGEDEEFRDSLDGVKRGSEARRSFKKRKNRSQSSLDNEENCTEKEKITSEKKSGPENSRVNTVDM
ncbi:hypothetical protein HHI36_005982 [Cryptolaemus montrouzieri]|uniref:Uncharacterized protein n=1 Tax=Cryptolaemus montrouzieri TaxID=559131 RepID=A0ABD2NVT7_9CUCU